jgi:isocitrate dehydrogenase
VGADFFVESEEQPTPVAEKILAGLNPKFELVTISNRGTQVWPKGSVFTNLVNQYRCRIESKDAVACTQEEILELYQHFMNEFKVCSIEILNMWGDKKGYSLAQGQ